MGKKPRVFTGNQGLNQMWWETFVRYRNSSLDMELFNLVALPIVEHRRQDFIPLLKFCFNILWKRFTQFIEKSPDSCCCKKRKGEYDPENPPKD